MKKWNRLLFGLILFCVCFIGIDGVKAENDKGYVVCQYDNIVFNNSSYDIVCSMKIVAANATDIKNGEVACVKNGINLESHIPTGTMKSLLSNFHSSGTNVYSCPKLNYSANIASIDCVEEVNPNYKSRLCTETDNPVVHFKEIKTGTKIEESMAVSAANGISGSNVSSHNGDGIKTTCRWDINALVEANPSDINANENGGYLVCDEDIKQSIIDRANQDAGRDSDLNISEDDNVLCTDLLGDFASVLSNFFFLICIVGVVILIFTMSGDFLKAITSGEADAMAKAFKDSKTRIIATIILLLLPVIINFIITVINNNVVVIKRKDGTQKEIKIGNVSECNVTK